MAGLFLIPAGRAGAQTFTNLHSFIYSSGEFELPLDGAYLWGGLALSGNTLYGATATGGTNLADDGTVFSITTDGSNFNSLYSFSPLDNDTNVEGATPEAGLILSGNTLYGTAFTGGDFDNGSVFAVGALSGVSAPLHSFTATSAGFPATNSDGANPQGTLFLSGTTLYGTALNGGTAGFGTVFSVNTSGSGFKTLHSFTNGIDGFFPYAGVIVTNGLVYGTVKYGGHGGAGVVFSLSTSGTNFIVLHAFSATSGPEATNSDGANPYGSLVLSGGALYGTAESGGRAGFGTVFGLSTNGSNFVTLHSFTAPTGPISTNSDGATPFAGLVLSGDTLYGTATAGGTGGSGTVFSVTTNRAFETLYSFTATDPDTGTNSDGALPYGGLVLADNTLYGTTWAGGSWNIGTVFSIALAPGVTPPIPMLTISHSGTNAILTWPTNATGFTLQFTTNLDSPADWTAVTSAPGILSTNNAVTNVVSGKQKFYRLTH
jgi:uncharacterized repeat protein (TIGR03803 family)